MNPYHVLEVPSNAEMAEIRASYRRLARVHHPDCALDEIARVAASERMVRINWAWHIVGDAQRRATFDAQLQVEQIEFARRQQEVLRAQMRGQVVRAQQAHLNDILRAQSQRQQTPSQATAPLTLKQRARESKRTEQQEHENRERARQRWTRPVRKRLTAQEKQGLRQERVQLRQMKREDKKLSSPRSARRQLAEAARLFRQEGRASEAIAICQDVLRVDFRSVPARELLGDFYLQLGREDRTLPLWEQALALQPGNSVVRRKLNALRSTASATQSRPPAHRSETGIMTINATGNHGFWGRVISAFRSGL